MVCYAEVFSGDHGRSPSLGRLETSCSAPWRQTQHALSTVSQAMGFVHFSLDNLWVLKTNSSSSCVIVQGDCGKFSAVIEYCFLHLHLTDGREAWRNDWTLSLDVTVLLNVGGGQGWRQFPQIYRKVILWVGFLHNSNKRPACSPQILGPHFSRELEGLGHPTGFWATKSGQWEVTGKIQYRL